ncbi:hypothetical protein V2J09_009368, partial [Rumex salicifolius]
SLSFPHSDRGVRGREQIKSSDLQLRITVTRDVGVDNSHAGSYSRQQHRKSSAEERNPHSTPAFIQVIKAYASNRIWFLGFLMDIFGAILMLRALSLAPVSVIQPVSGCGLAILSVFSHFYLKELMNAVDWVAIVLAGIGTIGIGAGGEEQEAYSVPVFRLPWLAIVVVILFLLLNGILRIYRRQRRQQELMQSEVVEEIIYGLESGILFGMASVVSKLGFVLWEQGFSKMLVPTSILISIGFSATGFFYQTRGLKHGRAVVVSTCAAIASILTGVLAGMFALGEHLPSAPGALSSTRLISHLPWQQKRPRSGSDKRGASIRGRDSNPSAVIHTITLHNLLASSSREKP